MALTSKLIQFFRLGHGFWPSLLLALFSHTALSGPGPHMGPPSQGVSPEAVSAQTSAERAPESSAPHAQASQLCPAGANQYQKTLLITAFPQRLPGSSTNGGLQAVEQRLPALLGEQLANRHVVDAPRMVALSLPNNRTHSDLELAQQARQLAETGKAQLVLSGEIVDMSMARPNDSFNPGVGSRTRNTLVRALKLNPRFDSRQRDFAFEITLRDAVTGAALLQRQYHTTGAWGSAPRQAPGFDSPAFWKTHYGEQVAELVQRASDDLATEIQCQPLMATLDLPTGARQVTVHSGLNQGLKAGDQLRLYKLVFRSVPGEYQLYRAHLLDAQLKLTLEDLKPGYSIAALPSDLELHGRYVASTLAEPHLPLAADHRP